MIFTELVSRSEFVKLVLLVILGALVSHDVINKPANPWSVSGVEGLRKVIEIEEEIEGGVLVDDLTTVSTACEDRLFDTSEVGTHHDGSIARTVMSSRRRDMIELTSTTLWAGIIHAIPVVALDAADFSFVTILVDNSHREFHWNSPPHLRGREKTTGGKNLAC